jgi:hypothetical protein
MLHPGPDQGDALPCEEKAVVPGTERAEKMADGCFFFFDQDQSLFRAITNKAQGDVVD